MHLIIALFFILVLPAPYAAGTEVSIEHEGLRLNAQLEKSAAWPNGPTLLITHGTLSHNRSEIISTLQALFLEYDISSLAINLSLGLDNRQGPYDCAIPHRHQLQDAVSELDSWLKWLSSQQVATVIPLGHSRGGNQTAWFATQQNSELVKAMILVAPALWNAQASAASYERSYQVPLAPLLAKASELVDVGNGGALLADVDFLYCPGSAASAASIVSYYGADPRKHTPTLLEANQLPVLVIGGSEDTVVPNVQQAFATVIARQPTTRVVEIDGADHFFRDLYADELVEQAVEFIAALPAW
jgi:pimeloyl-ACP methyl ester carboxylesterase